MDLNRQASELYAFGTGLSSLIRAYCELSKKIFNFQELGIFEYILNSHPEFILESLSKANFKKYICF